MKNILITILIGLLIYACAHEVAPDGGPIDEEPPVITEFYPENGSTNYDRNFISFTFSEYVDQQSVRDAIFISPEIEGKKEFDWSGKTLEINFENGFRDSTTYIVSVGTNVQDINNRNKMKDALMLTFSTGEKIDKFSINGNVFTKEPSGAMIFAYRNASDTLNPSNTKPDYISQVNSEGKYSLKGLREGRYRVYAFVDSFRDLLYNVEEDKYGVPSKEIILNSKDSLFNGLNFTLSIEDSSKPHMSDVIMTDQYHILVEFDEPLDSSAFISESFFIYDSLELNRIRVSSFYKNQNLKYYAVPGDTLQNGKEYFFVSENFIDKAGNKNKSEYMEFIATDIPDTIKPEIKINSVGGKDLDIFNPEIKLEFSEAVNIKEISDRININDNKNKSLMFEVKNINDVQFELKIKSKLEPRSKIDFSFNFNGIRDFAGNYMDTVKSKEFNVANDLEYSGLYGKVISDSGKNIVLQLKSFDKSKSYNSIANKFGEFKFENITPGNYYLQGYFDRDSSGTYLIGSVFPINYSEEIYQYPDTIELKPRWPVGDLIFNFKHH